MSLILDALKKAEQDRHAGQAPVMDDVLIQRAPVAATRRGNQQRNTLLVFAMIGSILFAIAGLVYWFWPVGNAPGVVAVDATNASPAAALPDVPQPAISPPAAALRVDPERLEPPIADAPESGVELGDTGAADAETMEELDGEAPRVSTKKQPSSRTVQAAAPVETVAKETTAPSPPSPAASSAIAAEAGARGLKEMPPAFRSEFPKLAIDVHVYDSNPLRRFVLINGKKYRETDVLVEGPKVIEITPNGLIVEHRGSKVLLELPR